MTTRVPAERRLERKVVAFVLAVLVIASVPIRVQSSSPATSQIGSLPPNASAADLEKRGDELRAEKNYFDALDYYRAALAKGPVSAVLHNKLGITELLCQRFGEAQREFVRAAKLDQRYAAPYNNLGVVEYLLKRYGGAAKQYEKAIRIQPEASYYSNLGTAYFAKKDREKAAAAYAHAVSLDPDVFEQTSDVGVSGEISSPEDRAHFSYFLAKLYASHGLTDRSLESLRRAMEEGYKGIDEVYKDAAFAELRKDPRFVELMTARPASIPE